MNGELKKENFTNSKNQDNFKVNLNMNVEFNQILVYFF